jgi:HEAT repeats
MLYAGCCSTDPAGLTSSDAEVRLETLTCMAEDVVEDLEDSGGAPEAELTQRVELVRDTARRALLPGEEPDAAVRAAALRVLASLVDTDSEGLVATRLATTSPESWDPNPLVRVQAVATLAALNGPDTSATLRAVLHLDPHEDVRMAAARELARRGQGSIENARVLVASLRDPSIGVRLHARRALRDLFDADLGFELRPWEKWLEHEESMNASPPSSEGDGLEPAGDDPYQDYYEGEGDYYEGEGDYYEGEGDYYDDPQSDDSSYVPPSDPDPQAPDPAVPDGD